MRRYIYILIGVVILTLTACGERHRAQSIAEDFLEQNMADASALSRCEFTSFDSTRTVSDSAISKMRQQAAASKAYSGRAAYVERQGRTLLLMRATFLVNGDTCGATFYLNPQLDGIVAFKENRTAKDE